MKDIHLMLPEDVYERLERESKRTMFPVMHLARRCVLDVYGADSVLPSDYTNHGESTRIMQTATDSAPS